MNYDQLKNLDELRKNGIITDEEFQKEKQKLLTQPETDAGENNLNTRGNTKFCSNCGAEVSENAVVCLKCGAAQQIDLSGAIEPKTWLTESILATLFCCLPFGIAGIVNAANVSSRFRMGDIEGAEYASAQAEKWTMVAFWIGVARITICIIYIIIMLSTGAGIMSLFNHYNPYYR